MDNKTCSGCNQAKAISEFAKNSARCKQCRSEYVKAWKKTLTPEKKIEMSRKLAEWDKKNRTRRNARQNVLRANRMLNPEYREKLKQKRQEGHETRAAHRRERYANDPRYRDKTIKQRSEFYYADLAREKKYHRKAKLKRYGVTVEEYGAMLDRQNRLCAICLGTQRQTKSKRGDLIVPDLAVDHCHSSGKVRGLLCNRCNSVLGYFGDDLEKFRRAIEYLTKGTMQ